MKSVKFKNDSKTVTFTDSNQDVTFEDKSIKLIFDLVVDPVTGFPYIFPFIFS